jgi:hypothetical protein
MILVFLSPPKPPKTRTLTPTRTTMLVVVLTLRHNHNQKGSPSLDEVLHDTPCVLQFGEVLGLQGSYQGDHALG